MRAPTVMDAEARVQAAQRAFDEATARVMAACVRAAAIDVGLQRGGLRADDMVVVTVMRDVEEAARALTHARTRVDEARRNMVKAAQPSRWVRQCALVKRHAPRLLAHHEQAQAELAAAPEEARERKRGVVQQTAEAILRFSPRAGVTA